jgi:hypothetical protein
METLIDELRSQTLRDVNLLELVINVRQQSLELQNILAAKIGNKS